MADQPQPTVSNGHPEQGALLSVFEVGRVIWEARVREAWGPYAETIIKRSPWPKHIASPDIGADHQLCIASARAVLKALAPHTTSPPDQA